jgi:hypothetical protein
MALLAIASRTAIDISTKANQYLGVLEYASGRGCPRGTIATACSAVVPTAF